MMTTFSKSTALFKSIGLIVIFVITYACSNRSEKQDQTSAAGRQGQKTVKKSHKAREQGSYQIVNGKEIFVYYNEYLSGEKSQIFAGDSVMLFGGEFHYLKRKTGNDTITVFVNEIGSAKPIGQYAIFDFKSGNKKKYYAFTLYYYNSYNGYLRSELLEFSDYPEKEIYSGATDCAPNIRLDSNMSFRKK